MLRSRMPLMPLHTVLFPGMPMPLVLWETRYLRMAEYCLENDSPFGVVLIQEGSEVGEELAETHQVGTTAEIAHYRDEGDHAAVMVVGRKRFRLIEVFEQGPYPEAEVELLSECEGSGVSPEFLDEIRSLFAEEIDLILQLLGFEGVEMEIPAEADKLSYMIAAHLRLPLEAKQQLLETDRCSERLAWELEQVHKERQEYRMLLAARRLAEESSEDEEPDGIFSDN